jgi:hypothetical protein
VPWQRKTSLWGSWVVRGPRHNFWFAGDTGYALLVIRCSCYTPQLHCKRDRRICYMRPRTLPELPRCIFQASDSRPQQIGPIDWQWSAPSSQEGVYVG